MTAVPGRRRFATMTAATAAAFAISMPLLAPSHAFAQEWPSKPVRIMVGASAGGGTDVIARLFAEKFATATSQSFVVENRPGASGMVGAIADPGTPVRRSPRKR